MWTIEAHSTVGMRQHMVSICSPEPEGHGTVNWEITLLGLRIGQSAHGKSICVQHMQINPLQRPSMRMQDTQEERNHSQIQHLIKSRRAQVKTTVNRINVLGGPGNQPAFTWIGHTQ